LPSWSRELEGLVPLVYPFAGHNKDVLVACSEVGDRVVVASIAEDPGDRATAGRVLEFLKNVRSDLNEAFTR
jgi:hypothetical protein